MTRLLPSILGLLLAGAAVAQLGDPTRPPSVVEPEGKAAVVAPSDSRLQSVLISLTRRVAVIDGKTVPLGAKLGEGTVEAITESTVVLRYAGRKETLLLTPAVDKRMRRVADAAGREKGTPR
jgi:MSHA biogenesis protein MshK